MTVQIDGHRLITSSDGDYSGGKVGGLADATILPEQSEEWFEALRDVPDSELTDEVRGYRDGLKEGLGR